MAEGRIFKWRHFAPEVILCAVRWYLRYSLSYREVQELLEERDLRVDHTTIWRWVQCYAPELEQRTRPHLKPTNRSWRVDETYVRIRGHWFYLYRALDSSGATIDFFLSAVRSADAAKALLSKTLSDRSHPQPRVINTDKARCYPLAISEAKDQGIVRRRCRHRPVAYLNNIWSRTTGPSRSGFVPSNISVISTARGALSKVTRRSTRFGKGKYDG